MIPPRVEVKIKENLPKGPALQQAMTQGLINGLEKTKDRAEGQWSVEAPRSTRGSGLTVSVKFRAGAVQGTLGTPRFEARLMESGTAAHEIKPKTVKRRRGSRRFNNPKPGRRVLAIPIGGQGVIFRGKVMHPGQSPTHWLSRSVQAGLPDIREAIYASLRKAFRA